MRKAEETDISGGRYNEINIMEYSWKDYEIGTTNEYSKLMDADIITLQEITKRTDPLIRSALRSEGYQVASSIELTNNIDELYGPRKYGLITATKHSMTMPTLGDVCWPERMLSVLIKIPDRGLIKFHNTHIPPGSSQGWKKIEMLEGVYNNVIQDNHRPQVLTGDFNCPQEELEDGTVITWAYKKLGKDNYKLRKSKGVRWDNGERNIICGLKSVGLVDAYRNLHGYSEHPFSFVLRNKKVSWKRRYDHCFIQQSLKVNKASYLHDVRESKLSDHSILEVCFT